MSDGQIIVRIKHVIDAGMCVRGAKSVAERNGFDFRKFLNEGYPVEELEATNDALILLVCEVARGAAEGRS